MTQFNQTLVNGSILSDIQPVEQFKEPYALKVVRLIIFSVVVLGSLIGNSVIIRAVIRARGVKSVTYILICNLALGELVSSICLPFIQANAELTYWPFSQGLCTLINPLQIVAGIVVTTCIASIAIVRCLMLVKRSLFTINRSTTRSLMLGIVIWIVAFIVVSPFFLYMTKVSGGNGKYWCILLLPGEQLANYYSSRLRFLIIVLFLINYAIPLAITLVSYGTVASKLRFRNRVSVRRQLAELDASETQIEPEGMTEVSSCPSTPYRHATNKNNKIHISNNDGPQDDELDRYESDLLRMFYAVVLIFIICYLPFQCFFLLEYTGKVSWHNWKYFDVTRMYLYLLTCLPSALHPICYGMMSEFYHKTFTKLVLCQ